TDHLGGRAGGGGLRRNLPQQLLPLPVQLLGAGASAGLLLMAGRRGWRAAWPFCLGAFLFFALTALFLFPTVPASVETEAYYYAPIVVVLSIAAGGLFSGFARAAVPLRGFLPALLIAVTGTLNTLNAGAVMQAFPYWFGFRGPAQEYVRDVLHLEERFAENGVRPPVYLSYPRPRRFDISTKWDIMLRIWNVDPSLIFAMMVPTLHLGSFEAGDFLGDPGGFSRFSALPEARYESAALSLADLPRRGWYDLARIRADFLKPVPEAEWFDAGNGERVTALPEPGLLGTVPRARLDPGRWVLELPPRSEGGVCLFALRADLQASGEEEVYYRERPLAEKGFRLSAFSGAREFSLGPQYGWSFRIYEFRLAPDAPARLEIETEGVCEVLGPVVLPVSGGYFQAWGRPAR
ncbi:MAG TPA: hypothetical protein PLI51_00595, partial [bacterium]|nr:hypothetical protein [bacterium]